ncbi:substrate-binding domain-containing protein [Gracilimonas mengyeensis]|uniref:Phosphate ABC transporter substrate-binding protein, PhoT family n=1 Tax=Gracilimonas mengyeensis TaxID=1302730 RepID=A0A521B035_9BACT|nr:substrate-binding domain-containing protein [Gracilimonas mengyeensis]SMO40140.1 phosphate ABC transporter substrate-binding protein, PhoT family [Gracilimonas mengyeensis]
MKNLLSLVFFFVLAASINEAYAQSFQVIVNEANATESLSKQEVSDIFLKEKTKWADGTDITPIDLKAQSATRVAFSVEVHGRSVGAIRSHWQQAAFSGAGTAPLERSSDADVIEFVKANPGAVGYISDGTAADGVKVLNVQ